MRIRCIAFVPPAALVTVILFFLMSTIVSAIEATLVPGTFAGSLSPAFVVDIAPSSFDASVERSIRSDITDCGVLQRQALQVEGATLQCILRNRVCSASACEIVDVPIPDVESRSTPGVFLF